MAVGLTSKCWRDQRSQDKHKGTQADCGDDCNDFCMAVRLDPSVSNGKQYTWDCGCPTEQSWLKYTCKEESNNQIYVTGNNSYLIDCCKDTGSQWGN
ncbi:unnamed protein product, partial [Mesorhabditis spiculigera]